MLCAIGTLGGFTGVARSATLEGLLMPGPLHSEHAKQESDCTSCHNRADRVQQASLCSACHKDVAADIREKRGLHGKRPEIASVQCNACHSEHLGRNGRITPALPAAFDHSQTDFRIDGAHRSVACAGCHVAGKKFREAPAGCVDCHKKVEPHQGKLGTDCAACHETSRWSAVRYDHGKTRFALQARHAQIPCASCHAANRWKDTPMACASCHTPDDVHRGSARHGLRRLPHAVLVEGRQVRPREGNRLRAAGRAPHRRLPVLPPHGPLRGQDAPRTAPAATRPSIRTPAAWARKCESCHEASAWKDNPLRARA